MKLEAKREGNLMRIMQEETALGAKSVKSGIRVVTEQLKDRLRSQVVSAGLGSRLSKGVRSEVYPSGDSLGAAGLVFARPGKNKSGGAAGILNAFEKGVTIRAKGGRYLAIPTENVPDGTNRSYTQILEKFQDRLVFLSRPGGGWYVLLKNVRRGKRNLRKVRRARGKTLDEKLLMFILVPLVKVKKRLDWKQEGDRALALLPDVITGIWERGK